MVGGNLAQCPYCAQITAWPAAFCQACGRAFAPPAPAWHCPACSGQVEFADRFCAHCGYSFAPAPYWAPVYFAPQPVGTRPARHRRLARIALPLELVALVAIFVGVMISNAPSPTSSQLGQGFNPAASQASLAPGESFAVSAQGVPQIGPAFFGPNVVVTTYEVGGATPTQIEAAIERNGAHDSWTGGTIEASTTPTRHEHWQALYDSSGACTVTATADPAISISFVVDLPHWRPDAGTSTTTINWWSGEILRVATHEKHHVDDGDAAALTANAALSVSTCANVESNLQAVYLAWNRADCQFDLDEYGSAMGETMATCLANHAS